MRIKTLFVATLLLALTLSTYAQKNSKKLIGTWILVTSQFNAGQKENLRANNSVMIFKVIDKKYFHNLKYSKAGNVKQGTMYGRYTIKGNKYNEAIDSTTYKNNIKFIGGEYRISELTSNRLCFTGFVRYADGSTATLREEWEKVK